MWLWRLEQIADENYILKQIKTETYFIYCIFSFLDQINVTWFIKKY